MQQRQLETLISDFNQLKEPLVVMTNDLRKENEALARENKRLFQQARELTLELMRMKQQEGQEEKGGSFFKIAPA